jgi:hypothetical protein
MPKGAIDTTLTDRQKKYFATLQEGLERDTGKSLAEWAKIARKCPETKTRAREKWLKENYGHTVNRASLILSAAFPKESIGWDDPDALVSNLWKDAELRTIYERVDAAAMKLKGAIRAPRNGYTAWAREFQFAAARPHKGAVRLGLALPPSSDQRLEAAKPKEGWSERLKSIVTLQTPADVDAGLKKLLKLACDAS